MEDDPWSSSSPWDAPSSSSAPPLPASSSPTLPSSSGTPLNTNSEDDLGKLPSIVSSVRRPSADSDLWGSGGGGGGGGVWGSSQQDEGTESGGMDDGGWGSSLEYQHGDVSLRASNLEDAKISSPPISFPSSPYPPSVSFSPPTEPEIRPEPEFEFVDLATNDFSRPISPLPAHDIPSNTSFDDFGDFGESSGAIGPDIAIEDDPWAVQGGIDHEQAQSEEEEETSMPNKGWSAPADDDEDDAWGARKNAEDGGETAKKADEWERARRLAERRMARAPPHVISELTEKWSVLARDRYPDPDKKTVTEGEEIEKTEKEEPIQTEVDKYLDVRLANMKEITNLLVDLTDLPPTITSFSKPLYRASLTERRFRESLTRSSRLSNSTSLLVVPRRLPSLNTTYQSPSTNQDSDRNTGDSWASRSRLGEPENAEATITEDEQSSRRGLLSFFGRKVSGQTTPGMGKRSSSVSSLASFSSPPSEDATKVPVTTAINPSTTSLPVSQPVKDSLEQTRLPVDHSPDTYKPATPRPSLSTRSSSLSLPAVSELAPSGSTKMSPSTSVDSTSATSETPGPVAPSAVSRFLNRFSRKPPARTTDGPRALELSAGDFDFLAEVEGIESGEDLDSDFLGSFGVPSDSSSSVGGLEDFLKIKESKDIPLPAPLAPPPRASEPIRLDSTLGASVPKTLETPMDELDFLGSSGLQSLEGSANGTNKVATFVDEWDDFLSDQQIKPMAASSIIPSITPSITPSFVLPKPPSLSVTTTFPSLTPSSPLVPSRPPSTSIPATTVRSDPFSSHSVTPTAPVQPISAFTQPVSSKDGFADEDDFGDFGDFGQSTMSATDSTFQPSSNSFDDFDDFSSFSPASTQPPAAPPHTATIIPSPLSLFAQSPIKPVRISMLTSESPPPTPINKSPRHQRSESYARSFEAKNDRRKVEAKPATLPALLLPPPSSYSSKISAASLMDDSLFETTDHMRVGHPVAIPVSRTSTPITAPSAASPKEPTRGSTYSHGATSGSARSIGSMSDLLIKAQEVDVAKGHWTYTGSTSPPVMALPPPPSMSGSSVGTGASSPGFFSQGNEDKLNGFPVLGGMAISDAVGSATDRETSKGGLSQADLSFFDGL
ncbi:hypothetical protein [Phaffia rhodozyma]|uniref:Uncharacterized protein n=1 Tax=Phaffia rhodozyma TaxID=264483 RepID=A0A0F7SK81_PHARH|nr:hypothetical protein [Phaffia rhodozyma]